MRKSLHTDAKGLNATRELDTLVAQRYFLVPETVDISRSSSVVRAYSYTLFLSSAGSSRRGDTWLEVDGDEGAWVETDGNGDGRGGVPTVGETAPSDANGELAVLVSFDFERVTGPVSASGISAVDEEPTDGAWAFFL